MNRIQLGALVAAPAVLLLLCAGSASATVVTSPSALHPASTLIDFESFPVGTLEPITSHGATITTYERASNNSGPQAVAAPLPHQVQFPGIFTGNYFAPGVHHFLIEFDSPVSQFGVGIHDPNYDGNEIRVFDSAGNLIKSVTSMSGDPDFPTGPVGGVFSTFVGFVRPTADISYVEVHNAPGDLLGIDNVMFFPGNGTGAIPEPSTLALLGVIGCALTAVAWRKKAK